MAMDRWFIGGGAEHSPESARRLLYTSTGGASGIGSSNDLKVVPLNVPGGGVRVVIGSALIPSNYVGGETQTYMGTVYQEEVVSVTPTGSSPTTGRSDLIIMRVEDPFAEGTPWTPPADEDIADSPYIYIRVITGVPAGTTRVQDVAGHANDTAVTLARIDIPASTGTVTANMIKDLRNVANPKRERQLITKYPTGSGATAHQMPAGTYSSWPFKMSERPQVYVPVWAREVRIVCTMTGIAVVAGAVNNVAGVRTGFGSSAPGQHTVMTEDAGSTSGRQMYAAIGTHTITEAMRGTMQTINVQGNHSAGNGSWKSDQESTILIDIEFSE